MSLISQSRFVTPSGHRGRRAQCPMDAHKNCKYMKCSTIAWAWFSTFFEKAWVSPLNQLGIGVRRNPKPRIALFASGPLHGIGVLVLRPHEAPNLIYLNALAIEIAQNSILIPGAGLTGIDNQLGHGCLADAG
jgi:hypothetical protein